jgi:SAM-dependent methyltransferase
MSRFFRRLESLRTYRRNRHELQRQMAERSNPPFPFGKPYPCLDDRYQQSGSARGHYFHQDLLIARRIHEAAPETNLDVGSRIDGFVAHVAAFRPIRVLDIRPMSQAIPNIEFVQADVMGELPGELIGSTDSLSCLHALEHFGLGRYGDPVDYDGYLKGFDNLLRLLRPGGTLYLSVPLGPQRIEFDAHRVFATHYLLELFEQRCLVRDFSYVDDNGDLHQSVAWDQPEKANFGCNYGCGIFELERI